MGMSVGGLISGLDTDKIITQLQNLQKKPIQKLQQQEVDYQVKLSAYSTLNNHFKNLKNAARNLDSVSDITSYSATSGNTGILTASAEKNAATGNYSVTVHSLAAVHKLKSTGFDYAEAVGKGIIHLKVGSNDEVDIAVGAVHTLSDVAKAVNEAGAGVYASVISDGSRSFLTITAKQTGSVNEISLRVTEDGTEQSDPENLDTTGLSRLVFVKGEVQNLIQGQEAKDAQITVDGIANIMRPSNTISDVIAGVTLKLKAADPAKPVTVEVERSDLIFSTRLNAFLDAYNGLTEAFNKLQSYEPQTKKTGDLFADSTTQRLQSRLKGLLSSSVPGLPSGLNRLTDIGVKTNEDGKLLLDSNVFNSKLKDDFESVVKFFTKAEKGAEGFAVRLAGAMDRILDTKDGTLVARTKGIQESIKSLNGQIQKMNVRLAASEARLRAQFSSLEVLLGKYQSTSDALTRQLDAISGINDASNKR